MSIPIETELSRIDKLEKTPDELKAVFSAFMESFNDFKENVRSDSVHSDNLHNSVVSEEEFSDYQNESAIIPPLLDIDLNDECNLDEDINFDFAPQTKVQEPSIPPAKPHIESQGIDCLRLGKSSFNRIRYADVHKKLQASPVFSALQVNSQLSHMVKHSTLFEHLSRTDMTLGTILHGVLLQRDSFSEALKQLIAKHPTIKKDVQRPFSRIRVKIQAEFGRYRAIRVGKKGGGNRAETKVFLPKAFSSSFFSREHTTVYYSFVYH